MIAYAPAENPAVAMAIVIEDAADTGGTAAGPIVRRVLSTIFGAAEAPLPTEGGGAAAPSADDHAVTGGQA
jgi:hypothetical protein